MTTHSIQKQRNPYMYHSAFKLSIYFKNNKTKCQSRHSIETKTTVAQLVTGKVKEIAFDRRQGYQDCIDFLNRIGHKVHKAILFDAFEEELKFAEYTKGSWRTIVEPDFSKDFVQISRNFIVKNGFVFCSDLPFNNLVSIKNFNTDAAKEI
jgi:hypothetical protein